jgi:tetratricopeptide (TPR) repeat protein
MAARLSIIEDADDLDNVQPPTTKLQPVVFLEPNELPQEKPTAPYNIIHRELFRQAFLLAARDELGLTTRDAVFRELPPTDLPAENRLRVAGAAPSNQLMYVTVEQGPAEARKLVWRKEGGPAGLDAPIDIIRVLMAAETLSRSRFVRALQRAGFDGKPNAKNAEATVPPAAEKLLEEMTFPAQFAAARVLHAAIREQGESPALIAALSRAYANLGLLTECHWNHMHKGFKARALLYAQRLFSTDAALPFALWHRAYAEALAGMHRAALEDLALANEAKEKEAKPPQAPAWVEIIDAYCRFDSARLAQAPAESPHARLAHLLRFITVEDRRFQILTTRVAEESLKICPDCPRILGALATMGWMADSMDEYVKRLPGRLAEMPDLPRAVQRRVTSGASEAEVLRELAEAGRPVPDAGPSWTMLARLMQEARFVQVCHRLHFLHFTLAVPAADAVAEMRPLIADHPYKAFAESFGVDRAHQQGEFVRLFESLPLMEFDWRAPSVQYSAIAVSNPYAHVLNGNANRHVEFLYHDLSVQSQWSHGAEGARFDACSPYAPMARASQIHDPWVAIQDKVDAWEKESLHPSVQRALGQQYLKMKRYPDAQRCLKRAVDLSPEAESYRLLAQAYLAEGKKDEWLATLEESLKGEDPGLAHARTRVMIANEFMRQDDYKRALPYADAAAGTYAEWALRCAGLCHEGLGDWKKAEECMQAIAGRYDEAYEEWFFWCMRTGKGDVRAAQEELEKRLSRQGPQRTINDLMVSGGYHLLLGQTREALEEFRELANDSRAEWGHLMAALLHESLKQPEDCDRELAAVPDHINRYKPVAKFLAASRVRGVAAPLDMAAVEKMLQPLPKETQVPSYYFIGRYLELRGQKREAQDYYTRCVRGYESKNHLISVLAGARSRALSGDQ